MYKKGIYSVISNEKFDFQSSTLRTYIRERTIKFQKRTCPIREAAKKVLLLMAEPLRPNPPPPSSLMAVGKMERWEKRLKKSYFSLMARPLTLPAITLARPLRE